MKIKNNSIQIKNKLIFLVIMPVIALILISTIFTYENYKKHTNLNKIQKLIDLSNKTALLIHEIQSERGASTGYLGNKDAFYELLKLQREKTLKQKKELIEFLKTLDKSLFDKEFKNKLEEITNTLNQLEQYREKIDLHNISASEIIEYYTSLNKEFLEIILYISKISTNSEISLELISFVNLLYAKDVVGTQRALGIAILNNNSDKNSINDFYNLIKTEKIYMTNFFLYANSDSKKLYNKVLKGEDIDIVNKISEDILQNKNNYDAQYWFINITSKINKLKRIDDYLINQSNSKIDLLLNDSKISIFMLITLSLTIIFFVFILGYIISKNIHNSIENIFHGIEQVFKYINKEIKDIPLIEENISDEVSIKIKDLNEKILNAKKLLDKDYKFLEESLSLSKLYEYAIEKSNIILRIDLNKKITYANKLFYEVSGYTKEELIGKSYEFIKYPDVNDIEIDKLFKIIEAGKVWKGTLKNIAKNGKALYSIATVVPIKNKAGDILEYMQIRQDITEVVDLYKELEDTQREVIYKMGEIVETRSHETGTHVKVVAEYSELLALKCGLGQKKAEILKHASPMHDIGKVGIPDSILNKPDKLSNEEFEIMKSHTTIGYEILKNSNRPILKASAIVANEHHEKWDGSGYPKGLKGEDIHIYGRITALADVFDALASKRIYKKAWELNEILDHIKKEKGKHFDPSLVNIFFDNLDEFLKIRNKYKEN
jgi:PAS domain S-box-containing protein